MAKRSKKLLYASVFGAIIFIVGILMAFVGFPLIVDDQIQKQVYLLNGTDGYERWRELPVGIDFKVYLFHVENWKEVTFNGEYPKVIENGPYVYKQFRKKRDITYDKSEDSLTYKQYMRFEFDYKASGLRNEDDELIILNAPLNAIIQIANRYLPGLLMELLINDYWENMFPSIIENSMFLKVRVGDILFDGYRFCEPEKWHGTSGLICIIAALLDIPFIEVLDDYSLTFAFFNFKQDQHDGTYTVNAGIKDMSKMGQITQWNGYAFNTIWSDRMSSCNKIKGTDGTIYPPNLGKEDVTIFSTEICRTAKLVYVEDVVVYGVKTQKRILSHDTFADPEEFPEYKCYCTKHERDLYGNKKCLPNGFSDISPCYLAPLIASFPHFFDADETYAKTIEGLSPNAEKHQSVAYLEPTSGIPLSAQIRLQFNMILRPINGISVTQNISPNVCPVVWIEMGITLPEDLVGEFKKLLNLAVVGVEVLKWIIIAIGGALFLICGGLYLYKIRNQ